MSHEPDSNTKAVEKLTKINKWFCEQMAYLAKRLSETPEPGGGGVSLLDNTVDRLDERVGARGSRTPWTTSCSYSSGAGWISRLAGRSSTPSGSRTTA